MPELYTLMLLVAAALALQIMPGPDMMLVIGRGVGQGYRLAQATAFGIACAGLVQLPLLAFGLSTFVTANPWLLDLIRAFGAAYLFYLGFRLLKSTRSPASDAVASQTTLTRAVLDGAATNFLNPKIIVFQLAFLPQFVDPTLGPVWSQMLILGAAMKVCGFVIMSAVAATAGLASQWLARHSRWLAVQDKFVGLVMIGIGVRLLFDFGSEARSARS